ncbi:MAG: response regulator [Pseudomonadales bacterium]|nr:response regulator [Pseudomonadales bacterium]
MINQGVVLVLDDDPTLGDLIVRALKMHDCECFSAVNSSSAINRLESHPNISTLLVDYSLNEDIDGIEFIAMALKIRKDLRCILMSGNLNALDGLMPHGVEMLSKPCRIDELVRILVKGEAV